MSFCPIDNNEDLLKVYKYVRTALEKQIVEKKPVDIKAIANKLYNSVLARTKDQAKALSYAHLVPGLVRQAYGASQKVSDYFLDTNYSVDDAARLERSWREKPLEKVAEYLGLNQDLAKAAESAEQVVATEKQIESSNEQNAPNWIIVRDYALPSTLFATTGQEAQTDEENRIPENNIKDPEMAMYYKVQRALVSNPSYPGIKGQAHLTMMTMSRLPVRKMYPKTQRETENNPDLAKGYDKVFIQTVTDSDGNIIYFDQEGNVTTREQGMPVYFPVRLSLEQVQEPKTDEEAATLKKQEAYLAEMIDYISSNPDSNQIISAITGGSLGFLDSSKSLVPLTQLSKSLYPTIEFRVDESGAPFMRVPRYQQDVAIIMNNFSEDVARNIARLLLNDVVRGGQKLTTTQKASLLFPYLAPSTTTGLGFNSKSKEYFLNGKPIAQASEEEIVKALTETKDSQGNIVPSRYVYKNTAKNINKFSVKESNGVFTLSENIVPYSQFVTENASVGKKIEDGDFTPFNSYLNFLPTGNFVAAALGVKETTKTKPEVAELFDSNPELASVGTPEQYSQYLNTKDTPIVYHGSPEYFEKFDISKLGSYTGAASAKEGIFFGGSRDVSRSYLDKRGDTLNVDSLIKQKPELRLQSSDEIGRYYYEEDIEDYDTIYHTVVIYIDGTVLDSSDEYGDVYTDIDNYDLSQLESPEETKKKDIKWAEESVEWYKKIVEKNPGRENELLSAEKQLENSKNAELAPKPTKNILSKLIDPSKRSIIKAKIKFTDQLEKRTKHLKDTYDSDAGVYIDKDRSITDKPFENLFIRPFTLKLKNPLIVSDKGEKYREETYFERIQKAKELGHDGLIIKDTYDSRYQTKPEDVYVVFDSDVITELGGKQDIEGFKKFIQQTTTKQTATDAENVTAKAQEAIDNSDIQNSPKSAKDTLDDIAGNLDDPDIFNMLDTQKKRNLAATREQLSQAIPWYMSLTLPDGRKLSDVIPLKLAFNAVNMTSDGVATWTKAGITLWKGADTSDLYHEAWHGFSQVFLTNAQRKELYNQVRKKKGSFSDYMGNEVKYSEATKLQAEEWLAEQFREHMLRGGKGQYEKSKKSVIAKIFDAIYTALQHLFGGSSTRETLADAKADKNISDMFEKLRIGDLSTPNFEIEASFSEGLNKIKATRKGDPVQVLSNAESHLVFATIDSIMSDAVDDLNAKAKAAGKATAPYTLGILTDFKTRKATYAYVKKEIQKKLDKYYERALKSPRVPAQLKKKADLLTWVYDNFGNLDYADQYSAEGAGVIGAYEKLRFSAYTEESDQQDITSRSEYADKSGNEIASINLADPKLLSVMSSIRKYDSEEDFKNNKPVLNDLGFAELEDRTKVFNELSNLTEGSKNAIEVYNTLKKLADSNYIVSQFLNKVGSPLEVKTELENSMWGSIEKILTMPRVNVVNLDVEIQREKVTRKDDAGNETQVTTKKIAKVTVKPGEASRETTKVYNKMQSQFSSNETAYIKRNPKTGRNYLDTEALMKEFNRNYPTRIFEFLEAMGVTMPNVEAVRNGLQDKATGYPEMIKGLAMKLNTINRFNADRIKEGNSKDIIVIENVNDIFNDLTNPNYKTGYNLGASNTIKKELGKFYLRWTGDFSNSTVTTTMGKTKYERSNPNTITKMADSLNDGMNFQDVVQDTDVVQNTANGTISRMNHLSTERTPWSKVSLLLDELYDMKSAEKFRRIVTVGGEKLVQARINILDMDGSKIRDEEFEIAGIKSSISDPTTKFLQDFYMNLVYGTSEAVRHAGKSSTFLYQIVRAREGVKSQSKHYFEPSDFRSDNMGISPGRSKVLGAMRGYLAAEFERIHKAKTEESAKDKLLYRKSGKIVTLADTGSKFQMFDDILTTDQKTELLKLQDKDITTVEQFLEHLDSDVKLLNDIDTQLNKYLDKLVNESIALLDASGAMDSPYLFRAITNKIMKPGEKFSDLNPADVKRSLIEAFTFNQYIHNVETGIVFYGDPALYNHLKEEFHKRNAGIGSTGEIPRTGVDFQNFVNNKRGSYSKSKWYTGPAVEQRAYDGTFRSSVLTDKVTKSEYLKEYTKAAIDAETARLKSLNASQEQINKAEEVIKKRFDEAYGSMKEGDAQGWITLDSYRLLMKSLNKWDTNVHEKLYNKILAGEEVSALDVAKFFPVKKMQYWGPLATDGLPVYAFHKFSLMPLVPTVIKGTKLEQLHNKMVEQQIDYSLFESGSKIATIGTNGKFDDFLDNETRKLSINDPEYKFTPNVVFADYMKDQTEVAPEYKGKVTFSTQLRKLVEEGIIENGVPIDFKPEITDKQTRVEEWRKVEDKEAASDLWKKVKTYESKLALLTAKLKEQLVREVGWTEETNTPDLKKLVDFVEKQLSRQEIADNELQFIDDLKTSPNVNFDLSSYRGQIEKLLTAVVNKRLIRQKVNGEALIQVSGAGFEAAGKFANATEADIEKYGSNDLPFYKQDAAGTKAMKVKVALQGQFKKLLNLNKVAELAESEGISRIDALNRLIKDEAWLSEGNNRKMITMMGVRIPVQGLNSMEFMEVYEFLPEEAGNIIIPPAEIVAKSGSDFDIDKMTIQMPNISQKTNRAKLTSKLLNELQEANPDLDFSKDNVNMVLDAASGTDGVYTLTEDDKAILDALQATADFQVDLVEGDNSIAGLENGLMYAAIDLISDPANFVSLVTPNGTDIAKPISEDLGKMTREYSSRNKFASEDKGFSATRIYEPLYNIYKLDYNAVGKAALGLGAVDNTYNTIFNRIGAYLSDVTQISTTEGQTKKERNPYYLTNRILMPHNTINGKISLSHMYDVNNENKISDVFSQLINGWVDVEKDEWIFDLQGNKELAPILLLLVQSGVSLEQAALFVSQPMIREYVKDSKLRRGTFAPLIDKESDENQHAVDARNNILFYDPKFGFNWDAQSMTSQSSFTGKPDKWQIFNAIKGEVSDADASLFTKEGLKKNIENFNSTQKYTKEDRKAFMHFLELEQMSKGLTEIKLAMNYDTTRSGSLFEARAKLEKENKAAKERGFDKEVFEAIIANSPIGSFKVQDFMLELWEPFFPVTSSPAMNNYLSEENIGRYIARGTSFAGDPEGAIESFRSQIIPFLFQNDYYSFKIGKLYRGREIDGEFALKKAEFLRRGALHQDGKIYYDTATVNETFNNKDYSSSASNIYKYFLKNNVAPLQPNIFSGFNDVKAKELYQRFLLERESLRGSSDYNFDTVSKTKEYKRILSQMRDLYRSHNKDLFKAEMEMTEETPDETRKEIETKVKDANATAAVWAYETYLRNAAMDNMNLPSHLFHGSNSYAEQFMNIKKAFPTLSKYYPVMEALDRNSSNDKNPITNLVLRDSRLTKDQKDLYAENIAELSDASTIKNKFANISMEDAVDIAKFFSRFTTYAYIQGATTPKSTFNVLSIANPSEIGKMLMPSVNNFISLIDKVQGMKVGETPLQELILDSYLKAFKKANPSKKTSASKRYKIFDDPNFRFYADPNMSDKAVKDFVEAVTPKKKEEVQPSQQQGDVIQQYKTLKEYADATSARFVNTREILRKDDIEYYNDRVKDLIEGRLQYAIFATEDLNNRQYLPFINKLKENGFIQVKGMEHVFSKNGLNPKEEFERTTQQQAPTSTDKILEGDIFALPGIPVITTNLGGVHGAGLAQAAKTKGLVKQGEGSFKATDDVVQLPVKKEWSDNMSMNNNMELLKESLRSLIKVSKENPTKTYLLPLAGLGHGEGSVEEILPLLIKTVKASPNIKLVIPAEGISLGRQGTVRKDYTRENLPKIKAMLSEAGLSTTQSQVSVSAINNPAEYTNHSGGAVGADSMFDAIGNEYGQTNHKHYYYGSKTPKGNVLLTEEQVKEGIAEMNKAAEILGRKPSRESTINLLARNWFQVKNSTQIVAIAPIDKSMKFVEGGTGWAVAMAQANNKEINVFNLKDNTWYKWNGTTFVKSTVPILAKNFAGIGSRQDNGKMTPASIQAIRDVYDNTFKTQQQVSVSTNQQVVSEPYGVVVAETKPSADKTQDFVDLIQPQIRAQAYKENASGTANDMFMYGLRWTRKSTAKAPLNNKSYANKGLPITDAKAKDTYVYDTLDQNGNPLAPVSDLQPIITEIQNALGIDMSNYDAVIGNIYLPGQNIATHRDTTESLSARNYPVVVYTIGNNSGIGIYEDKNNPGSPSFASNSRKEIPTQNGTIYTFGMDGKGRFELAHDTPKGVKRDQKFPPITLPNGTVVENYTITLTFRRAADLEAGMPTSPAKIGKVNTTNQQIASQPVATPVTTVLGMGKQQRTGVPTFTIPGIKAKDDKVGTVESKTFNQTNINAIKEANPNTMFIGSGIAIKPGATTRNTTGYAGSNTTLVQLGPGSYGSIPYKYLPNVYKKDGTLIPNSLMTDETYDDNIQVIEDAIQQIVENLGDKDVVLDANGYGQELLGRDPLSPSTIILDKSPAPKTFVYLSKRLYEEFGFINPNSLGSNTIVNTVQSNQRVNELELFNKLKNEALSCSI